MARTIDRATLRRARVAFSAAFAAALALTGAACDPGFPTSDGDARIGEETFVDTYVELRLEALSQGGLTESERDRILAGHGVSEDDLREFIEVHGRNVPYMDRVWREVDERIALALDELRTLESPGTEGEDEGVPPADPGPELPGPG